MPDPRDCQHVLAVDDASHTVYCTVCAWWWDADFETPSAAQPPADALPVRPTLNPDNEPTSEHMQWSEDNDTQR
jgi:hypothetical protein